MSHERLPAFVESVRGDARVLGVARLEPAIPGVLRVLLVTTWDGGETLPREIARLAAALVGGGSPIERVAAGPEPAPACVWTGVGEDGSRAEVIQVRAGDLVPTRVGAEAQAVHDPRGIVANWLRACRALGEPQASEDARARRDLDDLLAADAALRAGAPDTDALRGVRRRLAAARPAEAALAARIDAALAATPLAGDALRVVGRSDPGAALERFLATADGEGFKGDRVLFGDAAARLRALSGREPVFEHGFVVPTFDAVEAALATGDAGALRVGVYVGVGVTPGDALEFWAAPYVREADCSVPCVDDDARRGVVLRAAGREPMLAALRGAVDAAWARLPALVAQADAASAEPADADAVLAPLHLPRSFVARAKGRVTGPTPARLDVALALARAGDDCAPLAARKFGLTAGRVLSRR